MKRKSLSSCCGSLVKGLSLALLTANLTNAQNFVKNADFEQPLGSNPLDNWVIVYVYPSGPSDFLVAGRTTFASKDMVAGTWDGGVGGSTNYWSKFGGHFAPNHNNVVHAYFRQIVTGLQPGAKYACSAWMVQFARSGNANHFADEYMEAIGTQTLRTASVTANAENAYGSGPTAWARYTLTNTADGNGRIELRLHYNKTDTISLNNPWEYRNCNGFFDRVSVVPEGQTEYLPPYAIVSTQRTGPDVTLQWETVMNNRYRIQASTNIFDPAAWRWVERSPRLDTNFIATGTTFAFVTNVSSLFYYDTQTGKPELRNKYYFDPDTPLYFRIFSTPFPL